MEKKRVLVAMSGGTDSSAACMLLQEQGYEIEGITMRMWEKPAERDMEEPPYIREARLLAERLHFPHHVLNIQEDFRRCVVNDFIGEYMHGRTPNPCVQCNIHIKMKYLIEEADRLGCDYVATGHYARITEEEGVYYVEKGADVKKDQSYFLWGLGQEVLSRMIFPLGGMTKEDARNVARRMGFVHIAEKSELPRNRKVRTSALSIRTTVIFCVVSMPRLMRRSDRATLWIYMERYWGAIKVSPIIRLDSAKVWRLLWANPCMCCTLMRNAMKLL